MQYRKQACKYISEHKEEYQMFLDENEDIDEYISNMEKNGTWGGQFEISALSKALKIDFVIFYLDQPNYIINLNKEYCKIVCHLAHHQL